MLSRSKRKERSCDSESDVRSPEGKKICESSQGDISWSEESDVVIVALDMTEKIASQLEKVLQRLESVENKLEGVLKNVEELKAVISGVKEDVMALKTRTTAVEHTVGDLDRGVNFINDEIQNLNGERKKNREEICKLHKELLYQEVYNRRENLRFIGIPETPQENTSEVVYRFLENELEIENVREIEFQRIHRVGKKRAGLERPIIARFLRFPDRERIFKKAVVMRGELDARIYADYPKEIAESRRKQWPRLKRAREEGKVAAFSRKEPDKLFVDGQFIPV